MPMKFSWRPECRAERALIAAVLSLGLVICLGNVLIVLHLTGGSSTAFPVLPRRQEHTNSGSKMARPSGSTTGKERILEILRDANVTDIPAEKLEKLPTWDEVVSLYGDHPVLVGLDTCQDFQSKVPPAERFLGVAGTFNSGTNLLAELLIANCRITSRQAKYGKRSHGIRWQVNWGKHQVARWRLLNQIEPGLNNEYFLPVVSVRDNYSWMQSMCRRRYAAHWFHSPHHCPNLIPNYLDWTFLEHARTGKFRRMVDIHHRDPWLKDNVMNTAGFTKNSTVVPLYVRYKLGNMTHISLAHLWNDWYRDYYEAGFPRVMLRFEDLVFHAKEVISKVCHCAGGDMENTFQYIVDSAKKGGDNIHGTDRTNYLDAMIKYGSAEHHAQRTKGMTSDDVGYAREVFDAELMQLFGYEFPSE